jgi:integrase/recombinase XerD
MLDTHVKSPVTRHRLRSGPATRHVDAFAEWLHRQGYRPVTIDTTLRSLAGWTDWMRGAGLGMRDVLAGFDACTAELAMKLRAPYRRRPNRNSLASAAGSGGCPAPHFASWAVQAS